MRGQRLHHLESLCADRLALHGNSLLPGLSVSRPRKVIDGTVFSHPEIKANRETCLQSEDQQPGRGFPLPRLVGISCLKYRAGIADKLCLRSRSRVVKYALRKGWSKDVEPPGTLARSSGPAG